MSDFDIIDAGIQLERQTSSNLRKHQMENCIAQNELYTVKLHRKGKPSFLSRGSKMVCQF